VSTQSIQPTPAKAKPGAAFLARDRISGLLKLLEQLGLVG
jgi:hypothetical protein